MGRGREEIRHLGRSDLPVVVVEDLYEDGVNPDLYIIYNYN